MGTRSKAPNRRKTLIACVGVAAAVVASCLLGQAIRPYEAQKRSLIFARIQTPLPFPSAFGISRVTDIMSRHDAYLRKFVGNDGEGLFRTAYECDIKAFSWEPRSVNHLFSVEEVLIVPLDGLTDQQTTCMMRVSLPPNILSAVAADDDLAGAVRRLTDRDPLRDWR